MDAASVARIHVNRFGGIAPNHRGYPRNVSCCAWDVETARGVPYAWGFKGPDGATEVHACTSRDLLSQFAERVAAECRRRRRPLVVVWAHNLRYDLGVMLWPHLRPWDPETARAGRIQSGDVEIEYRSGKITFAKLRWKNSVALILDTFRFFTVSLDRAAGVLGLDVRKLPHPDGFGVRRIPLAIIGPYLQRDLDITWALGDAILRWHREQDLYPAISVPQLAMRTFRRRYVRAPWQRVPAHVWEASLLAYHAGRNGLYVPPGWYRVRLLDLNSAYPAAMRRLPSFAVGGRWERVTRWGGVWGFYRLYAGTVQQGRYPILFSHDFKPLADGPIDAPVWVTGHELQAARRAGLIRAARWVGYVWRPGRGGDRPLQRFVRDHYRKRQAAKSPEHKSFLKLTLNSLYGKFVARTELLPRQAARELRNPALAEGGRIQVAGVEFYPPAAAWICAQVRVWLWRMERRTAAYHSATDGVMVARTTRIPSSSKLGEWKDEGEGWALILRNKLYFVFSDDGRLLKCALHGFEGSPYQLLELVKRGARRYRIQHLREWIASANRGARPFVPEDCEHELHAATEHYWPPPCPVTVPRGDGWTTIAYAGGGEAHALPDH